MSLKFSTRFNAAVDSDDIIPYVGSSMPGDWRPFADDSPWNIRCDTMNVAANSETVMATIRGQSDHIRLSASYTPPLWVLERDDIESHFFTSTTHIYDTWDANDDNVSDIAVPVTATMYEEQTGDAHIIILSKQQNLVFEMSHFNFGAETCRTFNLWDLAGTGYGSLPDVTKHWQQRGGRGSGVPIIGGLIRPEEIEVGEIRHALAFTFNQVRKTAVSGENIFQWPVGCRSDGDFVGAQYPLEGSRFRLDPQIGESELTSWGLSDYGKVLARALQRYGAFCVDKSPGNPVPAFQVQLLGADATAHRAAWDAIFGHAFYTEINLIPTSRIQLLDYGTVHTFGP